MQRFKKPLMISLLLAALLGLMAFSNVFAAKASDSDKPDNSGSAWLGVYMQDLNDDIVEALDISVKDGVLINHVIEDSPAEKAGIENGDIIVRIDDEVIDDSDDLSKAIKSRNSGDNINVVVMHKGDKKNLNVVLGSSKERLDRKFSLKAPDKIKHHNWIVSGASHGYMGVVLQSLGEQMADYFGVKDGVLITEVEEDSPASKAGLKAGDVILSIDGKKTDSPSEVSEMIREKEEGDKAELTVSRRGSEMKIAVEVAEREWDKGVFGYYNQESIAPYVMMLPDLEALDFDFDFDPDDFNLDGLFREYNDEYKSELKEQMKELRDQLDELREELSELRERIH